MGSSSSNGVTGTQGGITLDSARRMRRRLVKRWGKRAFRRLDRFLARQSLVANDPVLDAAQFPWTKDLEANWREIRGELEVLLRHRDELPRFQDISPDQYRISPDDQWRAFVFYGFGFRSAHNCGLCPVTASVLDRIPGIETAFFSILAPGKRVPPHRGITKGMIRCHLGLIVPEDRERCTMDVGDAKVVWQEGRAVVFDDTYFHSVHNDTREQRAVLLLDFRRPMTPLGRAVRRGILWALKRTAYVRDAMRNEASWERSYESARAGGLP